MRSLLSPQPHACTVVIFVDEDNPGGFEGSADVVQ